MDSISTAPNWDAVTPETDAAVAETGNAGLMASVDHLLSLRMTELVLPPPIMRLYRQRTRVPHRKMMASWANRVACINLLIMLFDFKILPPADLTTGICLHMIISLGFFLSAQILVNQRFYGRPHLIIIPPCLITVALTGVLGLLSQSPEAFTMYMTMGMTIVFIGIAFLQINVGQVAWMGAFSLVILVGFLLNSPLPNGYEQLQLVVFFASTIAALLEGRRIQYKYQFKAFLLQLREELRTEEAGQRNAKLSDMAYTDRLTDIPNRRYYEEMADTINAQPEASLPLSLCVFDIDHFKNLNDQLGHLQGDRCLRMVAQCLQASLRSNNDILARYGGEEFVLLLPNTNAAEAQLVAERIRQAVLDMNHPNPGTEAGIVTISAGIGTIERPGIRIETVFKEADAALYRAKTAGRNMVCA